jgi:hypothetical protein
LEVTESAMMADPATAERLLRRLDDLGVRISVDDFGTGYSSLGYLKRLPVAELKVDQSFVRDLALSAGDLGIVQAAIDLGHHLGLVVVAEGVEDAATAEALARLGCDIAQGYYFARPMPAADLPAWIAAHPRPPSDPGHAGLMAALSRVGLFRSLPVAALEELARLGRARSFPTGSVLMRRGDVATTAYAITAGRVRVEAPREDDSEATLAELGPGEIVGEMGVLERESRSATVVAVEDTEAIELDGAAFTVAVLRHPDAAEALLRQLSRRLRRTDELPASLQERWRESGP